MHRTEVHHFASPFAPSFPVGEKQWIHTGDPIEIVGLPTERGGKGGFSGTRKGPIPLRETGGEGDTKW